MSSDVVLVNNILTEWIGRVRISSEIHVIRGMKRCSMLLVGIEPFKIHHK
jgi:hypothetical protein